jgi:20S proteasome subunit beta 2
VIPSSLCQDEDEIGDDDQFELPEELFASELSSDPISNPVAFLSREALRRRKSSQTSSPPLVSTNSVCVHRSSNIDLDGANEEIYEKGLLTTDGYSSRIPSPSRSSFKKTGTTIAGCVVPGGRNGQGHGPYVILAADTRATAGTIVADKRCDKIHKLASNCRCCGAGTSADLDKVTRQVLYQMALQELQNTSIGNGEVTFRDTKKETGSAENMEILYPTHGDGESDDDGIESLLWMRPVSIDVLCSIFQDTLFRSGGQLGANLIVGGVWKHKAYLRAIHPHGSTDVDLPFTALGSGGLAAMAVLEEGYRSSLTLEEGIDLVQRAILSGIRNDLGSGSQVDLCVINPDGVCIQTRAVIPEEELLPDGSSKMNSNRRSSTEDPSNRTNRLLELLGQGDENEDEKSQDNDSKNTNFGVNGFGNQPFAIDNTKQRMVSVEMHQAEQKEIWDRVLGL